MTQERGKRKQSRESNEK